MSYFFIALFILLFAPLVLKEYNKDKGENSLGKTFNLIISIFLLYLFASTTKNELYWAFDQSQNFNEKIFIEMGILPPNLSGLSWMLHVTFSFILAALIILVVLRKEKYRKLFIKILPFYWILNSINFYKFIIEKNDEVSAFEYLIPTILILNGIFVMLIYVFYTRNFIKKLFQ
jgi:hypothetical protein